MMTKKYLVILLLWTNAIMCYSVPLNEVLNVYIKNAPIVKSITYKYQNTNLEYENYLKSFLPSISFELSPMSLNRSFRLLQNPVTGDYSYVNDYSNSSSAGFTISQKVGITGGSFSLSSNLGFLREFSADRNSFNTSPLYLSYSQPLYGEAKLYRYNKAIQNLKHELARKEFCNSMSSEQQKILSLYLRAYISKLQYEVNQQNMQTGDTLLRLAGKKLEHGIITKYEYNQIELQQLKTAQNVVTQERSYHDLLISLAMELGTDNVDVEQPDGSSLPISMDYTMVLSLVHQNNPQYLSVEMQRKQAEYSRLQTRNSLRFNGNVSLSFGMNQYGETLREAYRHPEQRQALAVTFSIPVFQWGINHNKRQMAENEYMASMLEIEKTEKEFENSIRTQVEGYNTCYKNYILANKTFELSREQYQLTVRKFAAGKISVYEVTSAYSSLLSSMIGYASSLQNVYSEYYALRHLALYDFVENASLENIYFQ